MRGDDGARARATKTLEARRARLRERLKIIEDGVARARKLRDTASETRDALGELAEMFARRRGDGEGKGAREDDGGLTEVERALRDAREASEPGARATRAIDALERDETRMFETWETLTTLEVDLCAVRAALARVGERKRGVFDDDEFERVDAAWTTFEGVLWNSVRQGILAGESGSVGLVRAVRVVAEQEVLDEEFERDALTFEPELDASTNKVINVAPPEPKRWKTKVLEQMSIAVEARLALIAEGFSGLDDKESIEHVVGALDESLVSLAETFDYTIPAFPPEWRVFETVVAPTYHAGVCDLLARLSSSPNTSNGDMVATVKWGQHYFNAMQSLGLDIEITDDAHACSVEYADESNESPPLPYPVGLSTVIETYCDRLRVTISGWTNNLCRVAKSRPPKEDGSGKLWNPSDLDFFRLIADQMMIAIETQSNVFVRQCGRVAAEMITNYASAVADRLGMPSETLSGVPCRTPSRGGHDSAARDAQPVSFETIVAGVNDTRRCRSLAAQTQKTILDALGMKDDVMVREFDHAVHVFNRVHAEARRMISRQVLDDPGLVEVMNTFYGSKVDGPWATGESMTTLLATVEDYLGDTEDWLTAEVAGSVTETLFEYLIELLFILFTKQASVVAPHTAARLEADERALTQSMSVRMSTNKAIGRIARLQNLRGLVCAASPDAFVHEYGVLLGNWPDAGLDCVAAVLSARGDFDKATSRATLERCRDVCITKLAAIAGERPSVGVSAATSVKRSNASGHRRTGSSVSYSAFNRRFKDFGLS